jgi:hypothetical protein
LIPALLLIGCSEYQVHRLAPAEDEGNWFDNAQVERPDADESDDESEREQDSDEDGDDPWREDESEDDSEDDSSDDYWGDGDSDEDDSDSSSGGGSGGTGTGPGESSSTARAPSIGEVIITELMIDPDAVADQQGEWVEIQNNTVHWLDLSGHRLGDSGVDDMEIDPVSSDSLIVRPGGFLVVCAEGDYWDNGGVECNGTIRWWTFGGGFAMSNVEDEVLLMGSDGWPLDRVRWVEGFVEVGGAMGLDPDEHSVARNDDLDLWCEQWSWLPFGDAGTPGETNDPCW